MSHSKGAAALASVKDVRLPELSTQPNLLVLTKIVFFFFFGEKII